MPRMNGYRATEAIRADIAAGAIASEALSLPPAIDGFERKAKFRLTPGEVITVDLPPPEPVRTESTKRLEGFHWVKLRSDMPWTVGSVLGGEVLVVGSDECFRVDQVHAWGLFLGSQPKSETVILPRDGKPSLLLKLSEWERLFNHVWQLRPLPTLLRCHVFHRPLDLVLAMQVWSADDTLVSAVVYQFQTEYPGADPSRLTESPELLYQFMNMRFRRGLDDLGVPPSVFKYETAADVLPPTPVRTK